MKQVFVIALCIAVSGCVGSSNRSRSFDKSPVSTSQAKQKPKSSETGIRISGDARFGVVYGS
jgi:hypothetical protein